MKNLFLLFAFIAMLNIAAAATFTTSLKWKPLTVKQDDKKNTSKKDSTSHRCCSKHSKAKCSIKKDSTHHNCSKQPKGKCCKMKKDSIAN